MFLPIQDLTQSNHSFLLKVSFLRTCTTPIPMALLLEDYHITYMSFIEGSLHTAFLY